MATKGTSWKDLADMYGFLGNSLLKPMAQTSAVGLDEAFWGAVPDFGDEGVRAALDCCARAAAKELADAGERGLEGAVERVSVEYTRLFVGPPSPAAPPWETMQRNKDATVGFGEATFAMRRELRALGLGLSNENNQYEDHMGIELLCLSEMCRRMAEGRSLYAGAEADGGAAANLAGDSPASGSSGDGARSAAGSVAVTGSSEGDAALARKEIARFMDEHPLAWADALRESVVEARSDGYFSALLGVACAVLAWHRGVLGRG